MRGPPSLQYSLLLDTATLCSQSLLSSIHIMSSSKSRSCSKSRSRRMLMVSRRQRRISRNLTEYPPLLMVKLLQVTTHHQSHSLQVRSAPFQLQPWDRHIFKLPMWMLHHWATKCLGRLQHNHEVLGHMTAQAVGCL
jgi:hypothetical protein